MQSPCPATVEWTREGKEAQGSSVCVLKELAFQITAIQVVRVAPFDLFARIFIQLWDASSFSTSVRTLSCVHVSGHGVTKRANQSGIDSSAIVVATLLSRDGASTDFDIHNYTRFAVCVLFFVDSFKPV